jgi:ribosome-associated translation inhibitor RaiA
MRIPTEITFHGIDHSAAVESAVERWVSRIEHMYDRITTCRVNITQPHKRHRHGSEFNVSIVLEVPGNEIAATHIRHEDVYVAVADAFRAARRQLSDRIDVRRGFVKTNVVSREGKVGVNMTKHRAM